MIGAFRKKPVVIHAAQWDGTAKAAIPIIDWILTGEHAARYHDASDDVPNARSETAIDTLEGTISASPGDWIIRGVKGEFYPCKPDIFEATYDPEPEKLRFVIDGAGHMVAVVDHEEVEQ